MTAELSNQPQGLLSTLPASDDMRRLAVIVVAVSVAAFLIAIPFAKLPLGQVWAFIPIYQSALVVNDLITAVLLFGQYHILRSKALLMLATGYLFTALIATVHALTFPGLFAPAGLLGAGPQTTAWLYMFWHGVFPLLVIAYALMKGKAVKEHQASITSQNRVSITILQSAATAIITVFAITLVTTAGQSYLPPIMSGHHYTPVMIFVVSSVWTLSLVALLVLWQQRPHSVLDLWLMVVMCAWLFDILLAAVLNAGRFDLGFYAGRIYGLLAASLVLAILLLENGALYARLIKTHEEEHRQRQIAEQKSIELATINKELDSFSYSISHDLRAPLRAIGGFTKMLEEEHGQRLDAEGHRLLGVVQDNTKRMQQLIEDLLAFARLGRQPLTTIQVQLDQLVQQTISDLNSSWSNRKIDFTVGKLGVVEADPTLLKQVITNLLSNAIKFTRDKSPAMIEVGCQTQTDILSAKTFYIKDNGAGFDMRYANKLFGVFQRLHSANEYEGTGVGLAIVQKVIERHGGRVWADSTLGEGSSFYFTLQSSSLETSRS